MSHTLRVLYCCSGVTLRRTCRAYSINMYVVLQECAYCIRILCSSDMQFGHPLAEIRHMLQLETFSKMQRASGSDPVAYTPHFSSPLIVTAILVHATRGVVHAAGRSRAGGAARRSGGACIHTGVQHLEPDARANRRRGAVSEECRCPGVVQLCCHLFNIAERGGSGWAVAT